MTSLFDELLNLQTQVALRLTPLRFAARDCKRSGAGDDCVPRVAARDALAVARWASNGRGHAQSEQPFFNHSKVSLGTTGADGSSFVRLTAIGHVEIHCTHGVLWVTVRGSVKDWILYPGFRVALSPGQEATATGLPCGDLRIERPGGRED